MSRRPFLHHHLHPPLPPQPESVFGGSPFAQCHGEVRRAEGSSRWVVCSIQSHKMSGLTVIADKPAAAATQGAANLYSTIHTQTHRQKHTHVQTHKHTYTQTDKYTHTCRDTDTQTKTFTLLYKDCSLPMCGYLFQSCICLSGRVW